MKLLELIPELPKYTRISRAGWEFYLIRSEFQGMGLIKMDLNSMQIEEYMLTINDLMADDWELWSD
jgi:hypothetical protein